MTLSILATALDFIALGWSFYLVARYRDVRLVFLTAILLIFVYRETTTLLPVLLSRQPFASFSGTSELRLTAAVSAILVVFAVDRLFAERTLAFQSLLLSETRYHTLVDTIPHGIVEIDVNGNVILCNQAFERLLGYGISELRGKPIWSFCKSTFEADELRTYIQRLVAEKTTSMQHFGSFSRIDETRIDLQMHWNLRRTPAGQLNGLVAVATDVTDRKRTERVLRLIVQGTASSTGVDFFRSLVRHLADALQVKVAFVAELVTPQQGRYLALWTGDGFEEHPAFDLTGRVHESILEHRFVSIPRRVADRFPDDPCIAAHQMEAYMALPLYDSAGKRVGFMGVMHDTPLQGRFLAESILKIFAARAAVELQRKQAEEAVRASETQLRTIVQEMPVMMCAFDDHGKIVAWNRECEAVTGYSADEIVGNPQAMSILYPADEERQRILEGWCDEEMDFRNRLSVMTTKGGSQRSIEWSKTSGRVPIPGWAAWGIGVDVTDRQLAEEERQRSEAKSRAVIDAIPDLMLQIDEELRCTDFKSSRPADTLFLVNDIAGRPLTEILPHDVAARIGQSIEKAKNGDAVHSFEFQARKHSESRAYDVRIARTSTGEYLCIFRDVTDRVRLQKEILEISSREQRRIGQDLHDGLGQLLTAIAFLAQALQQRLTDADDSESAEQIVKLVHDAISKTRGLARGLCPVQVEENGLVSALQDLAADVETLYGIRCDFDCSADLSIQDSMVATNLYRIAQEAVTNALRHGEAKHIRLMLTAQNGDGMLSVTDDGVGVPNDLGDRKGLGLSIMSYRATMIGGALEVHRATSGGTVVRCPFPRAAVEKVNGVM